MIDSVAFTYLSPPQFTKYLLSAYYAPALSSSREQQRGTKQDKVLDTQGGERDNREGKNKVTARDLQLPSSAPQLIRGCRWEVDWGGAHGTKGQGRSL